MYMNKNKFIIHDKSKKYVFKRVKQLYGVIFL